MAVEARSAEKRFSFLDSAMLGWACIASVIVIYGIIGVKKNRPSYLLPYICKCVGSLIFMIIFMVFLWSGTLAMQDKFIDAINDQIAMDTSEEKERTPEDIRGISNGLFYTITVILIIGVAIYSYGLCVVYSYYKQMQEEDKGIFNPPTGTDIVNVASADQAKGISDCSLAYSQQPAAAPYASQNAGYPQLVAVYSLPPQNVVYPPQNVGYPQQQFPNLEKQ